MPFISMIQVRHSQAVDDKAGEWILMNKMFTSHAVVYRMGVTCHDHLHKIFFRILNWLQNAIGMQKNSFAGTISLPGFFFFPVWLSKPQYSSDCVISHRGQHPKHRAISFYASGDNRTNGASHGGACTIWEHGSSATPYMRAGFAKKTLLQV